MTSPRKDDMFAWQWPFSQASAIRSRAEDSGEDVRTVRA